MKVLYSEGRGGWGKEREVKLRFDVCPGLSVFLPSYSVENKTDDDINKIIMMRLNNRLTLEINLSRTQRESVDSFGFVWGSEFDAQK